MNAQRELLDQLMGATRNGDKEIQLRSIDDPSVCRAFLSGLCGTELLINTKDDAGICPHIHDQDVKIRYDEQLASNNVRYNFEADQLRELEHYVVDCDRRIARSRAQLQIHHQDDDNENKNTDTTDNKGEQEESEDIKALKDQVEVLLRKAEELGEEGQVNESLEIMRRVEALNKRKEALTELHAVTTSLPISTTGVSNQVKLRVCEVCGARLSILDSAERLADHFIGKLHMAYKKMRECVKQVKDKQENSSCSSNSRRAYLGTDDSRSSRNHDERSENRRERDRRDRRDRQCRGSSRDRDYRDYRDRRGSSSSRDRDRRSSRDYRSNGSSSRRERRY